MNFIIHLHIMQCKFKCKYKNKYNCIKGKCNSYCEVIDTTQIIFCSVYMYMCFVLSRTVNILNNSISVVFIAPPDSCIFKQHFLPLAY